MGWPGISLCGLVEGSLFYILAHVSSICLIDNMLNARWHFNKDCCIPCDIFFVSTGTLTTARVKDGQRYCKN